MTYTGDVVCQNRRLPGVTRGVKQIYKQCVSNTYNDWYNEYTGDGREAHDCSGYACAIDVLIP